MPPDNLWRQVDPVEDDVSAPPLQSIFIAGGKGNPPNAAQSNIMTGTDQLRSPLSPSPLLSQLSARPRRFPKSAPVYSRGSP